MPRRVASVSLAALALLVLSACQTVPIAGRSQLQLLSEPEENRMGLQAYREILRMSEASRGRGEPPDFLSTHPSHGTRVRQIEQWLPEALQYYRASPYRS